MFTLNSKGRVISFNEPVVMGILNITPDSFFSGSRNTTIDEALIKVETMLAEGALIIDIGGQSTSPSSSFLPAVVELARVLPVIEGIRKRFPDVLMSIDSFYAEVVKKAVEAGADIVNDISGGQIDEELLAVAGTLNVPYVLMHMRGKPQTMQQHTAYDNLLKEVLQYFIAKIEACKIAGIKDIIIDPGFGFAKTREQSFELMENLEVFKTFGYPVLAGISRKSMLYKTLGITPDASLNATTVMNTVALMKGAYILRVHDVAPAVECIKLIRQLRAS